MRYVLTAAVAACAILTAVPQAQASRRYGLPQEHAWRLDRPKIHYKRMAKHRYLPAAHARKEKPASAGEARGGLSRIYGDGGSSALVLSSAASAFQAFIDDIRALGFRIGNISGACLAGGHMPNSKHHWGGACDFFNQYARNRTHLARPAPSVTMALAEKHGLTDGCQWRDPDCGHIEVSHWNGAYAAVQRRHYHRARVRLARD